MSIEDPTQPARHGSRPTRCPSCGRAAGDGVFCGFCGVLVFDRRAAAPVVAKVRQPSHRPRWMVPAIAVVAVGVITAGAGISVLVRGQDRSASMASPVGGALTSTTSPFTSALKTNADPTVAASFTDLYANVQSGVVRISATTCNGGGIGTGFLISPTLVATAAHVVEGAAALALEIGEDGNGGSTSGVVIGIDRASDIALIKTKRRLSGHLFTFAKESATVGQEVAAIGFPEGEPMTLTRGTVSGMHRTIEIEGVNRSGLIQTDTAINPGNSGGPMLATSGRVYGVVDAKMNGAEGIAYAVSGSIASERIAAWKGRSASVVSAPCDAPVAPAQARD